MQGLVGNRGAHRGSAARGCSRAGPGGRSTAARGRSRRRWPGGPDRPAAASRGPCPAKSGRRPDRGRCCGRPCPARRRPRSATRERSSAPAAPAAELERALDKRLGQVAGAHAVGRELLAGEMDQPHVASQEARPAEIQEDRRAEHQGGGGRVVVVGPGRRQAGAVAAAGLLVAVFHVGRVVVVGHDHRPAAIAAGNHHQQVALFEPAVLVAQPAAQPGERKSVCQRNGRSPTAALPVMPACCDQPAVIVQQVVAQGLQVAMMMLSSDCVTGSWTQSALSLLTYRPWASRAIVRQ